MPKTTIFIDDDNKENLEKTCYDSKGNKLISERVIINQSLRDYFTDITNKQLLAEMKKLK